jgi:phage terminase large subunit-like protein
VSVTDTKPKKPKGQWGGRRDGAGAKPLTAEERHERALARAGIAAEDFGSDPVRWMAGLLNAISPRVAALRPDLAAEFEVMEPVEHLAVFARTFCRYTQLGEVAAGGPELGDPFEFEEHEREFLAEALACDERGRRVYKRAGLEIARKNRKTTLMAVLSLYFGSPADGEHRPLVVQAAGVKEQAGKLYDTTKAFIDDPSYGSMLLRKLFAAGLTRIECAAIGGEIRRVAGDGDNNHSLDPHVVMADELHTWKTPKQRENWKALTTAQGGRLDPFIFFITTEGEGDDNELAALHERLDESPNTEIEQRRAGLTIFRNRRAGMLVYRYEAPGQVKGRTLTIDDLAEIKLANPAPWRTLERIAEDLADPFVDTVTKLRLYANRRAQAAGRWISDERWAECCSTLEIPKNALVTVGVDAARTRDTTACVWSWLSDDGVVVQRSRVWTCVPGRVEAREADVFVPGGRLDNDLVRDFIRYELMRDYAARLLFFDERYFDTQANDLSKDGMTVVEMHQGKPEMVAAWDEFYKAIHTGPKPTLAHNGDPVFNEHRRKANGLKTERGWNVSKKTGDVIDALAAAVMSRYGCVHFGQWKPVSKRAVSW